MATCMEKTRDKLNQLADYLSQDKIYFELLVSQVFVLFFIALYVVVLGSPEKVSKGFDPDHQACGVDLGYENHPFIYFVTPSSDYQYRTICVEQCPQMGNTPGLSDEPLLNCRPNSVVSDCNQNPSIFDTSKSVVYYDTFPFKDNVCIPTMLPYFNEISDAILPSFLHRQVHDINHTKWEVIFFGSLIALALTLILMRLIDDYYQQVMWLFIVGTIALIAFAGIFFCNVAVDSYLVDRENKPRVTNFKVTEEYILRTANNSSVGTNLSLGLMFIALLFISAYKLYQDFDRTRILLMILKLTDTFMEANKKLKQFSSIMFGFVVFDFAINYYLLIYLLSCVEVDDNEQLPFQQAKATMLQFILVPIVIFSALWKNFFMIGCLEYVTVSSIEKWFNGILEISNQNRIIPEILNQNVKKDLKEFENDHVKVAVQELVRRLPQVAKASLLILLFTFPKMLIENILDFIKKIENQKAKDYGQRCFKCFENYYKKTLQSIELVIFVEITKRDCSVDEARGFILDTLSDEKIYEEFEKYANLGILFNTIGRAFIVIMMFVISSAFFDQITYYNILLYSSKGITIFCLFLGYSVSSLYLSIYGLAGQTLLYLLLLEKKGKNEQQIDELSKKFEKIFSAMYEFIQFVENEKGEEEEKGEQKKRNQDQVFNA